MRFQRQIALGLGQFKHRKKNAEKFFVSGPVVFRAFDDLAQGFSGAKNDALRVGDNKSTEGAAENNDEFKRLP